MAEEWYRLPDECTVFQAEITAIAQAAITLLKRPEETTRFVKIFVDSQAAILAMGKHRITNKTVARAVENLNKLANRARSVTLVWIPAHRGHDGNERADVLAKRGSRETGKARYLDVQVPRAAIKARIRGEVYREWESEWRAMKTANHARSFYGGPSPGKAKFVYKLARLELGRFARIISGHNNLGFFQTKIGLADTAECRFCKQGNETIMHLFSECPCFMSFQMSILQNKIPSTDMKWSVRDLLNFSYVPGINEAFEGTWTDIDPPKDNVMDDSLDLSWLGDSEEE